MNVHCWISRRLDMTPSAKHTQDLAVIRYSRMHGKSELEVANNPAMIEAALREWQHARRQDQIILDAILDKE